MKTPLWFARLGSPPYFYRFAARVTPWLFGFAALFVAGGWGFGLFFAPTDFQQGDAYRILFVHVPAAWLSLFVYSLMASCAVAGIVWRAKMAAVIAVAAAPLGAAFTFLALATGAIWGRPMWGAWWVWDARLTSELILLFLYLGFVALYASLPDKRAAWRAGAILLVVGFVNVPVVHYSVEWWSSLHQPASVMRFGKPAMHPAMLAPLLASAIGGSLFFFASLFVFAQASLLRAEAGSDWARAAARAA